MRDFSVVTRASPATAFIPAVPRTYVDPGLSLTQILSIFWARRLLSISIMAAVLIITVAVMKFLPRTYTAVASLMVNYEVNDPLNGKELPVGQVGTYIATQVELMQTPEVLLAVVDRLNLDSNSEYTNGYPGGVTTMREWVAARIGKSLSIYQGQRGSQLIYVSSTARHPTDAALLANTVAEVYKDQDFARSTGPPGQRAQLYAQQLNDLKDKVDQAQRAVTSYHQRNRLVDEGNRANVDVVLLATMEGRLLEAQNARRVAAARAAGDPRASSGVLASPEIQALKAQLAAQESHLAQLNLNYTPKYPEIQSQEALIQETRRSLAVAMQSHSANVVEELEVADRLEQNMQRAVSEQRARVLATGRLHDEAGNYMLDLSSAQAVYKRALEEYDQIMFASAGHLRNVSLISRATPPVKASSPRIKVGLFLGGVAALFLGLGIPLILELINRKVRCRDDIERQHGIPVLIEFPRLTLRNPL
jgi:succinoglycan biosynthesis transport protein ExoP